jgi:hypothetical protein
MFIIMHFIRTLASYDKKLVSAIPAGLKCEKRNSYYRLLHKYIYSSVSKQTAILFFRLLFVFVIANKFI